MNDNDNRGPGFLEASAPVGFAVGFVLFCFALPVVGVLVVLQLLDS